MTGEQMAALHQPTAPNPLERPIKMGWLKKQRSIVKNWQQRYFVLRAQQLYYYKDEEDTKPQVPAGLLVPTGGHPQAFSLGLDTCGSERRSFSPFHQGLDT